VGGRVTESSLPRSRRLEPDARREQILECAVRLFGERPYSEVSTTELANEAGVTRGLIHHYFGTKRGLYVEVVRTMLRLTDLDDATTAAGSLRARVERSVDLFLDAVALHGKTFAAVTGVGGIGDDPEIDRLLAEADDISAGKVLATLGLPSAKRANSRERAMIRAYGSLVKGAVREWIRDGTLSREEVRLLLVQSLIAIVRDVLPKL
jgi:AcrR family transcriptional regulator